VAWGGKVSRDVPAGLVATQVSAGGYYNLALRPDGTVVAWGTNTSGQCNVPAGLVATQVSAGAFSEHGDSNHSLAIESKGIDSYQRRRAAAWMNLEKPKTLF
jgi:alpha-tubulin suppressor-like RCC1 family protein